MRKVVNKISVWGWLALLAVMLAGIAVALFAGLGRGGKVEVVTESEVGGVRLAVAKPSELRRFLRQAGFDSTVVDLRNGGQGWVKIKTVRIALVSQVAKPVYEINDSDGNLWDAVGVEYGDGELRVRVYRRDWREGHVNLLINEALWRLGAKTNRPFDQKLDELGKKAVNRPLFSVSRL